LKALFVSPSAVAAVGWARVTVSGSGFDPSRCGSYAVQVGTAATAVVECGTSYLRVLVRGPGGASAPAAVRVQLLSANGTVVTQHVPANLYVTIGGAAAPGMVSIDSAAFLQSGSSSVVMATASANWTALQPAAVYLLPAFLNSTATNTSSGVPAAAAAYAARVACLGGFALAGPAGQQQQQVTCSTGGAVPPGTYHVAMELAAVNAVTGSAAAVPWLLLSNATVQFDMVVTSVSPASGSTGGGTLLTITGSGFPTTNATIGAFVRVPRSATLPDGLLRCDVVSVSATQVTCRTRPYTAQAPDGDDPLGRNWQQMVTTAAAVAVVACGPPSTGSSSSSSLGTSAMCAAASGRVVEARCGAANASSCMFR
jgi:hypothetical protein